MSDDGSPPEDENKLIVQRREKLGGLRKLGPAYPNDFVPECTAAELIDEHALRDKDFFESTDIKAVVAGRMVSKRIMGKASFFQLQDTTAKIQVFVQIAALGEDAYESFKHLDIGDIVGVTGKLFKTKVGELTIKSNGVRLLTKSLRPLPEKFHGMTDTEPVSYTHLTLPTIYTV